MVRVGRLELPASCSQTCVGTFRRHSAALFGPFRRSGNSSLTLFCPACFKQNFLLLGWVWDWILYIKRSAVRDGSNSGPNHRREGAENAPHKQRISRLSVRQRYGGCFLSQIRKWTRTYWELLESKMLPYGIIIKGTNVAWHTGWPHSYQGLQTKVRKILDTTAHGGKTLWADSKDAGIM